jgi:hypothetical protein
MTTVTLTALPVVTYANLDCNIRIEAINVGGADIKVETETELKCRFQDTQKSFTNNMGEWTQSQAIAYTNNSNCIIGTSFSYGGYDYSISQVSVMTRLDGTEEGRKLYLTNKSLSS